RSRSHPCSPVASQRDGSQRPILLSTDLQLLMRVRPVANNMLLPAIEHQFDGSVRLSRQVRCHYAFIAGAELRAKAAAHELCDHTNLALWQLEDVGKLIANARRALGRGVN